MNKIISNYRNIINEIKSYEKEFYESAKNIDLVAVSKTFPAEKIELILNLGHRVFGENRVQEAAEKWPILKKKFDNVELHLIGPLQSNKAKLALEIFDVIQTLDREKLVLKVKEFKENDEQKKDHKFFIQVNTGNEKQKAGIEPDKLIDFVSWCKNDVNLEISGLMCIPPINESSAKHFEILHSLAEKSSLKFLSMGMSNDFKEAIKFGATHVRVGSGIFGKRD